MRRRRDGGQGKAFPLALLDLPLPLSPEDAARVEVARQAAGWSIIDYLKARVDRRWGETRARAARGEVE